MTKESISSAPGRVCFAGEDIDWISGPSILCAINLRTEVKVKLSKNNCFILTTQGSLNSELKLASEEIGIYSHSVLDFTNAAIKIVKDLKIKLSPIEISITSTLPAKAGLGSSATVLVASISSISKYYGLNLDIDTVCSLAYKAESEELKTGAGQMDMYSSGFGGLIYINSSTTPPKDIARFVLPEDFDIVIADTLTPRNTSDVIRKKRLRYQTKEPKIMKYVDTTEIAIQEMKEVLSNNPINMERLGILINKCHNSLRDHMCVSTSVVENGITTSLKNGAIGAKLTGTGMGGCFFAIVTHNKTEKLINSLKDMPLKVYVTKPSEKGLIIDNI